MKRFRDSHDLTEDLVEEILVRLPASSLVTFKSVCKWWKSLIADQRFIHNHLQLHITNAASPAPSEINLILGWTRRLRDVSPVSEDVDDDNNDRELDKRQAFCLLTIAAVEDNDDPIPSTVREMFLPLRPGLLYEGEGILKSLTCYHCNGIVCLVDVSPFFCEKVVFFNPALRQAKFLITPKTAPEYFSCSFGFGYDSKTSCYKFVRILFPAEDRSWVSKAEVYTLGTSSCKVIELDRCCTPYYKQGAYLNGVYYWLLYENGA